MKKLNKVNKVNENMSLREIKDYIGNVKSELIECYYEFEDENKIKETRRILDTLQDMDIYDIALNKVLETVNKIIEEINAIFAE